MSAGPTEDRIILTVGAIGRGVMSDPEKIRALIRRQHLEEALEPFRGKDRERGRAFDEVLEEGAATGAGDEGETAR